MTKCAICKKEFIKFNMAHKVCGAICAGEYVFKLNAKEKEEKARIERIADKKAKERLKNRFEWIKQAQTIFNSYIRYRDFNMPCISCGRHHNGQYHAGHYLSTGARPNLRFNEQNVHKQCAPCNTHLSGNLINYRINLIKKIGEKAVLELETNYEPKKYTIDDLREIIEHYREKIKIDPKGELCR
jgi:hypothetical protein